MTPCANWVLIIALDEGARWDDSTRVRGLFWFVERADADAAMEKCKRQTPDVSMEVVSREAFESALP